MLFVARRLRLLRAALSGILLLCCASPAAARFDVVVVTSDDSAAYAEFTESFTAGLAPGKYHVATFSWRDASAPAVSDSDLIVAVGVKAAQAVEETNPHAPVLNTLIPRAAFDKIARQSGQPFRQFSALYLDQPFSRQLALLRLALPKRTRLGALFGPVSQAQGEHLQAEAKEHGFQLRAETVGAAQEIFPALQRVLSESDVLLALPDPLVSNSGTVQNLLLTSYRHQVPVAGFSQAYVKAGALLAVYSTPAQLGAQAAEIIAQANSSGLPAPQHPRYFSVSVNQHVARSLEMDIESDAVLEEKLRGMEKD